MRQFKIIVEKHVDGYVAYPLGVKGIVIGQGDILTAHQKFNMLQKRH